MPEAKRIRQLIDVSSERPNDRDIFVYDKNVGKWVPMRGDFDERYYPREEADEAFQPAGSYAPLNHASRHASGGADPLTPANIGASPTDHNHDGRYYQQTAAEISHTRLRATAGGGATLSGTTHGIQAGPASSQNLAVGSSEIQSRFNGASSTLFLNPSGGGVQVGAISGNAGQVVTRGELPTTSSRSTLQNNFNKSGSTYTNFLTTSPLTPGFYLVSLYVSGVVAGASAVGLLIGITPPGGFPPPGGQDDDAIYLFESNGERYQVSKNWYSAIISNGSTLSARVRTTGGGNTTFDANWTTLRAVQLR